MTRYSFDKNRVEAEKLFALEQLLNEVFGPDQIIIRSTKLEILDLIGSDDPEQRLSAWKRSFFTMPVMSAAERRKNASIR